MGGPPGPGAPLGPPGLPGRRGALDVVRPPGRGPLGEPRFPACLARGGPGGGGIERPDPDLGGAPGGGGLRLPVPVLGGAGIRGGGLAGAEPMSCFASSSLTTGGSSVFAAGRLAVSSDGVRSSDGARRAGSWPLDVTNGRAVGGGP